MEIDVQEVFDDINLAITDVVSNRDRLVNLIREVVKNTKFPLEKRWKLFIKAGSSDLIETDYRFLPRGIDWEKFNLE
jgi:hypothetical protein